MQPVETTFGKHDSWKLNEVLIIIAWISSFTLWMSKDGAWRNFSRERGDVHAQIVLQEASPEVLKSWLPLCRIPPTTLLQSPRQLRILARLSAIYHWGDRQNINCILADITTGVSSGVRRNYCKMNNNAVRIAAFPAPRASRIASSAQLIWLKGTRFIQKDFYRHDEPNHSNKRLNKIVQSKAESRKREVVRILKAAAVLKLHAI